MQAQFQYHPILVSVHTRSGLFLRSHSTSLPLSLSFHQSLYYFNEICLLIQLVYPGHTLGLFSIHKFLRYRLDIFLRRQPFSYKLFYVNSRLFLRSLISLFNPCISCIVSLKLPLIKSVRFSACSLNSS